jgi:hypothetical protein
MNQNKVKPHRIGQVQYPNSLVMTPVVVLRTVVTVLIVLIVPLFGLLVIRGPVDGQGDKGQGYWGEKTAAVNWCEADYAVTIYVAEFMNTLSSLSIPLNGIYGLWRH